MSRIGKYPVVIPEGVSVEIVGSEVTAKGKLGEARLRLVDEVEISQADNLISLRPRGDSGFAQKMWGTSQSLVSNLVLGVSQGFQKNLELSGVGYRVQLQGRKLTLQLGFSHDVVFDIPEGIEVKCPDQTHIQIHGIDKQKVGQAAANIRAYRPPEPYKGKGIKYEGEYIVRKEGKKK
jgi:large subunit ribosomal protein L6